MTDEQLQQLAALTEAATPGPWLVSIVDNVNAAFCRVAPDATAHVCCYTDNRENDIAFISAARQAVPELLAEVSDLRRQLAEAQAWLERISLAAGADDATPAAILAALTE